MARRKARPPTPPRTGAPRLPPRRVTAPTPVTNSTRNSPPPTTTPSTVSRRPRTIWTTPRRNSEEAGYDEAYDAVLELIGDIIGYNDAKACLTEGDIMACIWTVVGFTPWGKGAKLVKNAPKIIKLWNRFRKAKKAREAVQKRIDDLKKKLGE